MTEEEEKLIQQELASLKIAVSSPNTTLRQMKECMVRLIYCEMLGYEASFGYIHAIKLAQQGNLLEKRVGYLAVSLFLHENHELLLLLVNTVLKDLQSTNLVEVCMALTVVSQIFPREMIPAALPLIEDKLQHSKEIVRRKAVLALYKFYLIAPTQVQHLQEKFRKALCDRDVGVMAAALHIYLQAIKDNPSAYKDLTGSFVTILKQVVGGKLPVDFNYHSVPAPWLQIQLLRILRLLGKDDPSTSKLIYDVLDESLRRAELNHNITYAILYECVQTIYTICPRSDLFEKAAKCIGKFVLSPKINLKYLGLKALTYVVQQDPSLALQHQMTIIECLDHPDPIIKRETLELLYQITNEQNVTVIAQKMLEYLKESKDGYTIIALVGKIADLAEKYSPNNQWFVDTMNVVFSVGGDMVHPDIPNNFLRLLAEGFDDEKEDGQLRLYAVQSYLALLEMEHVHYPQRFLQVISWVLGEYSFFAKHIPTEVVMQKLYKIVVQGTVTSETKAWVVAAMTKLDAISPQSSLVDTLIQEFSTCLDTVIRQQACELKALREDTHLMQRLFPLNSSFEDITIDASLSFMDGFVAEALSKGAAPYKPLHQRQEEKLSREKALNLEPYGLCFTSSLQSAGLTDGQSPSGISVLSEASGNSAENGQKEGNHLKMDGVKKVWGKEGYLLKKESKANKLESISPPLESGISLGEDEEHSESPGQKSVEPISEEDQEKLQLASSLFVGLGSSAVNLLGKEHQAPHKFKRKSKMRSKGKDKMMFNPFGEQTNVTQTLSNDDQLMSSVLHSTERPETSGEETVDTKASCVFMNTNLDIIQQKDTFQPLSEASVAQFLNSEPSQHNKIAHSGTLGVYASKVLKDDCLLLTLTLANQTPSAITTVSVKTEDSEMILVSKSLSCQFSHLEGHGVQQCWGTVQMLKPCNDVTITGFVTYQLDVEAPYQLDFTVKFELQDFIRPVRMPTEEFGKLWLTMSNEVKEQVQILSPRMSLSEVLMILKTRLNLHIVEIIGDEGLLACHLLPSTRCLLHCHLQGGTLLLWIRSSSSSSSSSLLDCLFNQCQKALEEH